MSIGTIARPNLTGEQKRALREFIQSKFELAELELLVREGLGKTLSNLVKMSQLYPNVISDLIEKLDKEREVLELVEALIKDRPKFRLELEAIRDSVAPHPSTPTDLHRFRQEFRERRRSLDYLRAYKSLHEVLHRLSGQSRKIEDEASARANEKRPIPDETEDNLREWADDAERWIAKTDFPNSPKLSWVRKFQTAVDQFLGEEAAKDPLAFANIARLPSQNFTFLNDKLVACARQLGAGELVELIDKLPIADPGLIAAAACFRDPCVQLEGLIRNHDLCQLIDCELQGAAGLAVISPATILGWKDVQEWLGELVPYRPDRVTRCRKAAATFQATPSKDTFSSLMEKFNDLFMTTDKALLAVTGELYSAAIELGDKLEELR